jgi:amidase
MTDQERREFILGGAALGIAIAISMASTRETLAQRTGLASSEWDYRSVEELVQALQARRISSVELVERMIARIESLDQRVNAVVVRDFDRARETAKAADIALARGERWPLLGVPVTVKEAFNVAGLPTTWGIPRFKDFVPKEDAVIVSRVKGAGAVILGKTNVPLLLGEMQSYNEVYGTTNNPWDLGRSPGGSSGGSAAALAAGLGPLSLGSDQGGSIRGPAHFCGVYGHKPTLWLVPDRGQSPPLVPALPSDSDLAVVGPMARTAADLALALDVVAGPDDARAGMGYRLALPPPRHDNLRDFRVLVVDSTRSCRRQPRYARRSIACRSASRRPASRLRAPVRCCPTLRIQQECSCDCYSPCGAPICHPATMRRRGTPRTP